MTPEPASEPTQVAPAESASPSPPSPSSPPPSSRGVVSGLLVLLAAAVGVASFPLWRDQAGFPTAQPGFAVETLRAELSATSAKLAQLEARLAQSGGASVSAPADDGRLAALEQALRSVQAQPATPSHLAGDVETLSKQVAELRKTAADAATMLRLVDRIDQADAAIRELQARRSSAAALLLATGQLREALGQGQAFDAELRAAKVLAGEDAEAGRALDILRERAASGIAPRAALADRFEALAPALLRAEILPEGEGWQRRVMDRILSLVTIRREDGSAAGASAAAIVARIQAALTRGDLAAATAEAEALTGGPARTAESWLAEAKARLAADKAVSELASHAVALAGVKP